MAPELVGTTAMEFGAIPCCISIRLDTSRGVLVYVIN
jgi:hypothetical protein